MADGPQKRFHQALLSLGSNVEPEKNLLAAVRELGRYGRVRQVSGVWQSPPLGNTDQPDYLNAALWLETSLSAWELKETAIAEVEARLGRVRGADRNAQRTIDIDIMLFNHECFRIGQRSIPDPEVLERPFVAIPLAEIAPDYIHPETGETLAEIAARFDPENSGMRLRWDLHLDPTDSSRSHILY
jgi:2-amino-4-hydroxy-6-hydroxymethyldihydropteridine diphosphokinase